MDKRIKELVEWVNHQAEEDEYPLLLSLALSARGKRDRWIETYNHIYDELNDKARAVFEQVLFNKKTERRI